MLILLGPVRTRARRGPRSTMPDLQARIAEIQQRIVEADLALSAQTDRIAAMAERGYDTATARALLRELESLHEYWHVRRGIILEVLAKRR